MRVDAAVHAEPVLRDAGVEPVHAQRVRALCDMQPRPRHRGDDAAASPAQRAVAASRIDDAIRQIQFQYHGAAMARRAMPGQDGGGADLFDHACACLDAVALNFWRSPCGNGIPCGSVMAYPSFLN